MTMTLVAEISRVASRPRADTYIQSYIHIIYIHTYNIHHIIHIMDIQSYIHIIYT